MSATYLLAHVSPGGNRSAAEPSSPTSPRPDSVTTSSGHTDAIWCSKWAKLEDGTSLVITAGADHTIKTWNPLSGKTPTTTFKPEASLGIVGLDVDPSEQGANFIISNSLDSVMTRWTIDGKQQARTELGPAESWDIACHPTAPNFATSGQDGKTKILSSDLQEFGKILTTMEATGKFGQCIEYSQDGRLLAVGSNTGYVTLFDAATGQLVSTFPAHSTPIRSLSFTDNLLITGADDRRINLFDLRSLTNSSAAAANSSQATTSRRGQIRSLGGHESWVTCVRARPLGERLLASASADGTIKLWDLHQPGTALNTLRDHEGDVWSLSWMPEKDTHAVQGLGGASAGLSGGMLISGGEDGAVRWWRGSGSNT